jgi:hypothetical protein
MLRAASLTLLVVALIIGCVQAQRGGAGVHGFSGGPPARSTITAPHHFGNHSGNRGAFSTCCRHRHDGFCSLIYPYWPYDYFPYDDATDYERPYAEVVEREPQPAVTAPLVPERPPAKAQVIEIPGAANLAVTRPQPVAIFILESGERLEATRFVLTSANLSVSVNRRQRTIPLAQLNLDATLAANHDRGIDLRIPADQNEISLSF